MEDINESVTSGGEEQVDDLVLITRSYVEEASTAKQNRMRMNRVNFDCYHLRQDFSHKTAGQSREFLPRQAMAVEQIVAFIQQGLVDVGDWFGVELAPGVDPEKAPIKADEAKLLIQRALDQCSFISKTGDAVKLGLLQSLMIAKLHGHYVDKPVYYTETKEVDGKTKDVLKKGTKKVWEAKIDLVRGEDFYPDPTGNGLYFGQEIYMDISELYEMSEENKGVYDRQVVENMSASFMESDLQTARKARETGQNTTYGNFRKRVKIHEFFGTIIDRSTGKIIHKNVFWTIADDRWVIRKPTENPFWHGEIPFVFAPFIRVPHSVWHKSLMDGPTQENIALNELFNLMFDAGMNDAHGIKQIRPDWLEDESQVSGGVYPGLTLKVNANCPPMAKALERVDTSSMSAEAVKMYELMSAEFSASALTNDLRMGVLPNRAVKATEVVEASQSITTVFTGITKVIEVDFIEPQLSMTWKNILQHLDGMDQKEIEDLLGQERAQQILAISKEELFTKCCAGFKFKVYGISRVLAKAKDFRKQTALLQTLSAEPILAEEFMKEYSMPKFLSQIIKSLDISIDQISLSQTEKKAIAEASAVAENQGGGGNEATANAPDVQSQIPQVAAGSANESVESNIPRTNFGSLPGKAEGGSR